MSCRYKIRYCLVSWRRRKIIFCILSCTSLQCWMLRCGATGAWNVNALQSGGAGLQVWKTIGFGLNAHLDGVASVYTVAERRGAWRRVHGRRPVSGVRCRLVSVCPVRRRLTGDVQPRAGGRPLIILGVGPRPQVRRPWSNNFSNVIYWSAV